MNYGTSPYEQIIGIIDEHMDALRNEALLIGRTITDKKGVYLGQLDRLIKICEETEDFAFIFDQAGKQAKKLAIEMKKFNEEVVNKLREAENAKKKI